MWAEMALDRKKDDDDTNTNTNTKNNPKISLGKRS